jgi:curved DNA-binding protein CbpA
MTHDHFATLGQPRRPWLDPDAVKDAFHRLAATHHPDVSGETVTSPAINAAYAVLREPGSRLRHLLELEMPAALAQPAAQIPAGLAERFMEVATLTREVETFLRQQSAATSPLSQALLASERFTERRDLARAISELEADRARCIEMLRAEDQLWERRDAATGPRLAELQRHFAFLGKWIRQLEEARLRLAEAGE